MYCSEYSVIIVDNFLELRFYLDANEGLKQLPNLFDKLVEFRPVCDFLEKAEPKFLYKILI